VSQTNLFSAQRTGKLPLALCARSLEKIDEGRRACLCASFFPCFGIICNVPTQPISCVRAASYLPGGTVSSGILKAEVFAHRHELCTAVGQVID